MGYTEFVGFKGSFAISIRNLLGQESGYYINDVICNSNPKGEQSLVKEKM